MYLISFLLIFVNLKEIYLNICVNLNLNLNESEIERKLIINCSSFSNDYEIIDNFPYQVQIDPVLQYSTKTYALTDENNLIYYMNIVNQIYVPSIIYCLKYLIKIDIRNTSFCDRKNRILVNMKYLPSSLIHLGIYDCFTADLFEYIGTLYRLETLELSNISLNYIPHGIGNLSSLSFLSLPYNRLRYIPSTIKDLNLLSKINLKHNRQLRSIQTLNGLKSLKILDVRYCSIDRIPLYLSQLTNLYMSNNYLINLVGIETLGYDNNYKKYFYFDINRIELIPPKIRYVKNLSLLNLNHNYLDNLPKDLFSIMTLSHLYIQYNRFHNQQLAFIANKFKYNNPNLNLFYLNKSNLFRKIL